MVVSGKTQDALLASALFSLILNKPMAAWVSHLSRGWPLEWFWSRTWAGRGDVSRCPVFSFYEGQGCERSLSVFCAIPAFRLYRFLVNDQERTGETSPCPSGRIA